ncbi:MULTISPECIES: type III pantothenate kinase [unclassified Helicobacter]|uniref:type III pantothenate kinase n=1 Tax=unclassified Helicobacter TaxID=2593540 RepID=UPI000CF0E09F|nr:MULTISPECIES: type III pantothenate kinase [unclassified Helicobacter]
MILCDIGNTYFHFYDRRSIWKVLPQKLDKKLLNSQIYYISVCKKHEEKLLSLDRSARNIERFVQIDTLYAGMGVDRKAACLGISDGVIVDAGSAITIDVMQEGMHLGGCILPGLFSYLKAFEEISPILGKNFNFSINLRDLPQNTQDAVSFGVFRGLKALIDSMAKSKKIFFTGGDGKFISKFFDNSIYDEMLVFRGMEKALELMNQGIVR